MTEHISPSQRVGSELFERFKVKTDTIKQQMVVGNFIDQIVFEASLYTPEKQDEILNQIKSGGVYLELKKRQNITDQSIIDLLQEAKERITQETLKFQNNFE